MKEEVKKQHQYAIKLAEAISNVLSDEENENFIDQSEFSEGENLTEFIHALANLMPNIIYSRITGENKNILEFNHLANALCFQYANK
jgi:hypothetical protein